jgi:selenocysteine lyase/cysteine desulfurase
VTGVVDPAEIERAITADTLLVSVVHVSNVSGAIQPIETIGEVCSRRGVLYLVDAAQSLGHVPFDARACRADLVAFPGHKGLLGPQGTGGLYVKPGVEARLATVREGGTGHLSELPVQPEEMPQKYEAGSHNTIGIVGLSEGVKWLMERGQQACREHEVLLIEAMLQHLAEDGAQLAGRAGSDGPLRGLRLLGPSDSMSRCGTFTFVHEVLEPGEIAMALEDGFGVLARAGIHCAPRAHRLLGSLTQRERGGGEAGGALRMSMGPFVTVDDVRTAVRALGTICGAVRVVT